MDRRTTWIFSFLTATLFAAPVLAQSRPEPPPPPGERRDNRDRENHAAPAPPPPPGFRPGGPSPFGPAPNHKETDAEGRARAEHERQLAAQDAEREKTREERQRQSRDAELARIRAIPPSPDLTAELTRYAQRKAELERIKQVAALQGRADASKRCDDLIAKEEQRHAAWLATHNH